MIASAPTSDNGTERLGMIVAGMLRRKRNMTITTRPTASVSSNSTSSTEARMVVVRSVSGFTVTPPAAFREGRQHLFTLSTTWMTLAPGWR